MSLVDLSWRQVYLHLHPICAKCDGDCCCSRSSMSKPRVSRRTPRLPESSLPITLTTSSSVRATGSNSAALHPQDSKSWPLPSKLARLSACWWVADWVRARMYRRPFGQLDVVSSHFPLLRRAVSMAPASKPSFLAPRLPQPSPPTTPLLERASTHSVRSSGCDTNHFELELSELATQLSAETPPEHWHTPAGFLIHAMRAGSTAAANMVGASPDVVVLKVRCPHLDTSHPPPLVVCPLHVLSRLLPTSSHTLTHLLRSPRP